MPRSGAEIPLSLPGAAPAGRSHPAALGLAARARAGLPAGARWAFPAPARLSSADWPGRVIPARPRRG